MKKFVWNPVTHKKRIKFQAPGLFDLILLVISLAMITLSYDLNLDCFGGFNGAVFLYVMIYGLLWLIDVIVFLIICKKKHINAKDIDINEKK